jgi:hypothetical protein
MAMGFEKMEKGGIVFSKYPDRAPTPPYKHVQVMREARGWNTTSAAEARET